LQKPLVPALLSRVESLFRRAGVCFVLYAVLLVASFYPQSVSPRDTVAYVGDSLACVYIVGFLNQQILRDPAHWYDANFLYPNPRSLTFGDHLLFPSIAVGPVFWITGNPVLAYNVSVALACLLAAFGLRHLALRLGVDPIGAFAAGALYAFHTFQINEGPRLMMLYHGFIPLALADLIELVERGVSRYAWRVALWMLLLGLSSSYHLAYGCFLLGLVVLLYLAAKPRATLGALPPLALAAAVAGVLYLPVIWPYLENASEYGYTRELPSGIDFVHYLTTSPTNLWYGAIGTEARLQQLGPHFIGFAAIGGALLTLFDWAGRRVPRSDVARIQPRVWIPVSAGLAVLFIALSLGKDMKAFGASLGPGPYRLLFALPGFEVLRVPERLGLIAMLFLALLAGMAVTLLREKGFRQGAMLLALLLPLEHLSPLPITERVPVVQEVPAVYDWLELDGDGPVAEVPIHGELLVRKETLEMYFSTRHLRPIVHGYTSFPPLVTGVLRRMAADFPDDGSLRGLAEAGVETVVVHHGRTGAPPLSERLDAQLAAGRIQRVARFVGDAGKVYEGTIDEVFRIVSPPEIEPAPGPAGSRLLDPSWSYRTKAGDPMPATDEDLETAWVVPGPLDGDEFFEVTFPRPVRVSGLRMKLRQDSQFPTRFKIGGKRLDGTWVPIAFYDDAHRLKLLKRLLDRPLEPELELDWADREVLGLIVMVDEGGESALGWSIPEIEVLVD
jgi:hypothetical protein